MKVKDINIYNEWKEKNSDMYGSCVFRYVEKWADMMEEEISKGSKIHEIAGELSFKTNIDITGFMYGCAVNILAECWIYGDELRQWHNKKYNYDGEGAVNPAVLTISK